jgi:hypothetical protein
MTIGKRTISIRGRAPALIAVAGVAVLAPATIAACGDDAEGETTTTVVTAPTPEETTTTPDPAATTTETTTPEGETPEEPSTGSTTPLGSTEATIAEVPMSIDVTELTRQDKFVTLNFTVTNTSARDSATFYHSFDDSGNGTAADGLLLIDPTTGKEHRVVRNPGEGCLCSDELPFNVKSNAAINMYATFDAPPEGVTEMNVSFPGSVGTITGVPLS